MAEMRNVIVGFQQWRMSKSIQRSRRNKVQINLEGEGERSELLCWYRLSSLANYT